MVYTQLFSVVRVNKRNSVLQTSKLHVIVYWLQCSSLTPRTRMSTTVDILCFISTCITPDTWLLKEKYAFNLETLIYAGTWILQIT